jgi:hypothetical protein
MIVGGIPDCVLIISDYPGEPGPVTLDQENVCISGDSFLPPRTGRCVRKIEM